MPYFAVPAAQGGVEAVKLKLGNEVGHDAVPAVPDQGGPPMKNTVFTDGPKHVGEPQKEEPSPSGKRPFPTTAAQEEEAAAGGGAVLFWCVLDGSGASTSSLDKNLFREEMEPEQNQDEDRREESEADAVVVMPGPSGNDPSGSGPGSFNTIRPGYNGGGGSVGGVGHEPPKEKGPPPGGAGGGRGGGRGGKGGGGGGPPGGGGKDGGKGGKGGGGGKPSGGGGAGGVFTGGLFWAKATHGFIGASFWNPPSFCL